MFIPNKCNPRPKIRLKMLILEQLISYRNNTSILKKLLGSFNFLLSIRPHWQTLCILFTNMRHYWMFTRMTGQFILKRTYHGIWSRQLWLLVAGFHYLKDHIPVVYLPFMNRNLLRTYFPCLGTNRDVDDVLVNRSCTKNA